MQQQQIETKIQLILCLIVRKYQLHIYANALQIYMTVYV